LAGSLPPPAAPGPRPGARRTPSRPPVTPAQLVGWEPRQRWARWELSRGEQGPFAATSSPGRLSWRQPLPASAAQELATRRPRLLAGQSVSVSVSVLQRAALPGPVPPLQPSRRLTSCARPVTAPPWLAVSRGRWWRPWPVACRVRSWLWPAAGRAREWPWSATCRVGLWLWLAACRVRGWPWPSACRVRLRPWLPACRVRLPACRARLLPWSAASRGWRPTLRATSDARWSSWLTVPRLRCPRRPAPGRACGGSGPILCPEVAAQVLPLATLRPYFQRFCGADPPRFRSTAAGRSPQVPPWRADAARPRPARRRPRAAQGPETGPADCANAAHPGAAWAASPPCRGSLVAPRPFLLSEYGVVHRFVGRLPVRPWPAALDGIVASSLPGPRGVRYPRRSVAVGLPGRLRLVRSMAPHC
jgi:hypothetical protein